MIKITCSKCGKKLEAPDEAAGKQGKCPECGTVFAVPAGSRLEMRAMDSEGAGWRMKKPDGKIYGPCDTETMGKWIREGRVSEEDMLSAGPGENWKPAGSVNEFANLFPGAKEGMKCPGCGAAYPESTVICTSCGINLETGAKIGGQAVVEPAGMKSSRGKLVLEGALGGIIMGTLVFLAIMAVEILWDAIFEGWETASAGFFVKLLGVVIMGIAVGSFVGIVTVVTRSASAGQVTFVIPLAVILFQAWRSGIIGSRLSPFSWMFAIAGIAFSGWILYIVFGAVAQGVLKGIDWKKYE